MSLMLGIMDTQPPTPLQLGRGVDVGAPLEQQARDLDMTMDCSIHQGHDPFFRAQGTHRQNHSEEASSQYNDSPHRWYRRQSRSLAVAFSVELPSLVAS